MTIKIDRQVDNENLRIGRQIRDLRKAKGITPSNLGGKN